MLIDYKVFIDLNADSRIMYYICIGNIATQLKILFIMVSKYRCNVKTKPVSVRIDSDLLLAIRSQNLNLSATINRLLRGYLYIQSTDDSLVFNRLNASVPASVDIHIDVYSDISDDL